METIAEGSARNLSIMARYFIQNTLGDYLTRHALWTSHKALALAFDDIRGLVRMCERERLHDVRMSIEVDETADSRISVPIEEIVPTRSSSQSAIRTCSQVTL